MTPWAAHGAALEENSGAYARTIVDGEFLDVENRAGLQGEASF
jgi:hypothetical protein